MVSVMLSLYTFFFVAVYFQTSFATIDESSCSMLGPKVGRYFGEKEPSVYIEVNVRSESSLSFTIYLISRDLSDDGESLISRPVLGHVPVVAYSFDPLKCEITFSDQLFTEASIAYLNENRVETFSNLSLFYDRLTSSLPEIIRRQIPDQMTGSMDASGNMGLMDMIWVEPTNDPIDWQSKISTINEQNDINVTMTNIPLLNYDMNRSSTRATLFVSCLFIIIFSL